MVRTFLNMELGSFFLFLQEQRPVDCQGVTWDAGMTQDRLPSAGPLGGGGTEEERDEPQRFQDPLLSFGITATMHTVCDGPVARPRPK